MCYRSIEKAFSSSLASPMPAHHLDSSQGIPEAFAWPLKEFTSPLHTHSLSGPTEIFYIHSSQLEFCMETWERYHLVYHCTWAWCFRT